MCENNGENIMLLETGLWRTICCWDQGDHSLLCDVDHLEGEKSLSFWWDWVECLSGWFYE